MFILINLHTKKYVIFTFGLIMKIAMLLISLNILLSIYYNSIVLWIMYLHFYILECHNEIARSPQNKTLFFNILVQTPIPIHQYNYVF